MENNSLLQLDEFLYLWESSKVKIRSISHRCAHGEGSPGTFLAWKSPHCGSHIIGHSRGRAPAQGATALFVLPPLGVRVNQLVRAQKAIWSDMIVSHSLLWNWLRPNLCLWARVRRNRKIIFRIFRNTTGKLYFKLVYKKVHTINFLSAHIKIKIQLNANIPWLFRFSVYLVRNSKKGNLFCPHKI